VILQTLEEWESYIQQLAGQPLRSKGVNANTISFTKSMAKHGFTTDDVAQIILYFVRQFVATGQKIPTSGLYDMPSMALGDPVCMQGVQMEEYEADALAAKPPSEPAEDDGWDEFDLDTIP